MTNQSQPKTKTAVSEMKSNELQESLAAKPKKDKRNSDLFVKHQLSEGALTESFQLYDTADQGTIQLEDLPKVLRSVGSEVDTATLNELVKDHGIGQRNGEIGFPGFIRLVSKIQEKEEKEEDLVDVFRVLDQDGDGLITKADLREVVKRFGSNLTNHDIEEMINEGDKDGDGTIGFEEFVKLIMTRC